MRLAMSLRRVFKKRELLYKGQEEKDNISHPAKISEEI
jgi:hypothetical protein